MEKFFVLFFMTAVYNIYFDLKTDGSSSVENEIENSALFL